MNPAPSPVRAGAGLFKALNTKFLTLPKIVIGPAFPAPPKPFPAPLNSFFDSLYCFFGDKRNNRDYQMSSTIAWARNLAAKF